MKWYSEDLKRAQFALKQNDIHQAKQILNSLHKKNPDDGFVIHSLGLLAYGENNLVEALSYYKKAVEKLTDNPQVFYNYATLLQTFGHYNEAYDYYNRALKLNPTYIAALSNYSTLLSLLGKLNEAEAICKKIINLEPNHEMVYNNLGNNLQLQARHDEAISAYMQALHINPHSTMAFSNYLLTLLYSCTDQKKISQEHFRWNLYVKSDTQTTQPIHIPVQYTPGSSLKIGYISADFKTHSVGYFFEPILQNHSKNDFIIYCYSDVSHPDPTTVRLQSYTPHWKDIFGKSNGEVASMIKDDALHILVDLSGHTGNNRLELFLQRCAPLQISYLGYPCTTGISEMDYKITDLWADPQDQDIFYRETLYRLPTSFLCYKPPIPFVQINPNPPCIQNSYITFGSCNNLAKISDVTVALWMKILHALPDAQLFLKCKPFYDKSIQTKFLNRFQKQGIACHRIRLFHHSPSTAEHLQFYNSIDIALDTFPYNGTTTTCESLFMGVPVISRAGGSHVSRVGLSILQQIGLTQLIANTDETFCECACFLARHTDLIIKLRLSLRDALLHSSLTDAKAFTQQLEDAYRMMWNTYTTNHKQI